MLMALEKIAELDKDELRQRAIKLETCCTNDAINEFIDLVNGLDWHTESKLILTTKTEVNILKNEIEELNSFQNVWENLQQEVDLKNWKLRAAANNRQYHEIIQILDNWER